MAKDRFMYNAKVSRYSYGNLFCTNCRKRLGVIFDNTYKLIKLVIICKCDTEVVYFNKDFRNADPDTLYISEENGIYICRRCGKELFYIDKRHVINYAFKYKCECGKEYNRTHRRSPKYYAIQSAI